MYQDLLEKFKTLEYRLVLSEAQLDMSIEKTKQLEKEKINILEELDRVLREVVENNHARLRQKSQH